MKEIVGVGSVKGDPPVKDMGVGVELLSDGIPEVVVVVLGALLL